MIKGSRYVPDVHVGTREEVILGLMREYASVATMGMLRMHAAAREKLRIMDQLASVGIELYEGCDEDEGYVLGREAAAPHVGSTCRPPDYCACNDYPYRVELP